MMGTHKESGWSQPKETPSISCDLSQALLTHQQAPCETKDVFLSVTFLAWKVFCFGVIVRLSP
jgi:hypothetical protein